MYEMPILVALSLLLSSTLAAQPGLTFRASFDGHIEAEEAQGARAPLQVAGTPQYRPGRFGQALLCGDGGTRVLYPVAQNLELSQGTISLWVQPLNWQPSDGKMHVFLEAGHGGAGWLLFYKYYQGAMVLFRPQDERGQASYPRSGPLAWKPGDWHHLAATWMEGQIRLYIDGELTDTITETHLPEEVGEGFWLGDAGMGDVHKLEGAQTVLDEVRIFNRPLPPRMIRRLAQQWSLEIAREPLQHRWVAEVEAPWTLDQPNTPPIEVTVTPEKGEQPVFAGQIEKLPQGQGSLTIDCSTFAPGSYVVRAAIGTAEKAAQVRRYDPEVLTLENDLVSLSFDAGTGGLVGLRNKATEQVCRPVERVSPVFSLRAVDYDRHSRCFETKDWQTLEPTEASVQRCAVEQAGQGRQLVVEHRFPPSIVVRYTVSLQPGSPLSEWRITVENQPPRYPSEALLVHQVAFPIVSRLALGEDPSQMGLALPRYQGQYYRDPLQTAPMSYTLHYLGSASMSWMDLHDPSGGVYLASYDTALPQTELGTETAEDRKSLTLAIRRWSFLWPGETWKGGPCVVGLHAGDWHWGADQYRKYFRRSFQRVGVPEWIEQADGWLGLGGPSYNFAKLPKLFEAAQYIGLNYLELWSEMTGGDVTYHVYLYPNPFMGTVEELKAALAEVHRRGGHVGFYHNYVTTDPTLAQFLAQEKYTERVPASEPKPFGWADGWMNIALMDHTGRYRHLGKGHGYQDGYWAACPAAKAWQDYSVYWIVDRWAKEFGADAWYLDSVPPGYLGYGGTAVCWNTSHGHKRPQGVNAGVLETMRRIRLGAEKVRPFGLLNEGVCDFFYQYTTHALGTEVAGWANPPKPEIFTYTFPDFLIFSGSCNRIHGTADYYDDMKREDVTPQDALRRVHLMGLRYDILPRYEKGGLWPFEPGGEFVEWLKKLVGLRARIKSDLYASDFQDTLGLGPLPAKVEAKIFRHHQGKSLTVTLLDRREPQEPYELTIDAARYGIKQAPAAKLYKFEGEADLKPRLAQGKLTLTIPPLGEQVGAVVVRL